MKLYTNHSKQYRVSKSICINFGHFSFKSGQQKPSIAIKSSAHDEEESFYDAPDSKLDTSDVDLNVLSASYYKFEANLKKIQILLIDNKTDQEQLKIFLSFHDEDDLERRKFLEKCYLLTPLDLLFNIHQCIYQDDAKLSAFKVFGNLPLIDVTLSDDKLEQIIRLTRSIPMPVSRTYSDLESFNDQTSVATSSNEQQMNETQSIDDTLNAINKSDETVKLDLSAIKKSASQFYSNVEQLQQSINLEFSFEIKKMNFTLREEKPKYFGSILFEISSFGAFVQAKTFDTNINIYLNQIKCKYGLLNDVDGSELYLIKSQDQKDNKRFVANIIL